MVFYSKGKIVDVNLEAMLVVDEEDGDEDGSCSARV